MGRNAKDLKDIKLSENARYNGIVLPEGFRFETDKSNGYRVKAPYLLTAEEGGYAPDIVNIDVGRQLFVDDFLIDECDLERTYHKAVIRDEPVFKSERPWEKGNSAVPVSGGVWYDEKAGLFKMWYSAGFCVRLAYAESKDGINWERPAINEDGTNILLRDVSQVCSTSVIIDKSAPAEERYKLMLRLRDMAVEVDRAATLYTSPDGINWKMVARTGECGDRTSCFYDELNKQWVFSIRNTVPGVAWGETVYPSKWIRTRGYHSGKTFIEAGKWDWSSPDKSPVFWQKTDADDEIDHSQLGERPPQLYNVDAIAYESITLGMFQIWYGPEVHELKITQRPKITELQAMYSRDGFNFERPVRGVGNAFIPAARCDGRWDYGYVQSVTGGVVVYDDELRIYYAGFSGQSQNAEGETVYEAHSGGALGLATLRRDGFASLDGSGAVTTKPLTVTKEIKYLFVNANSEGGSLRAEILDCDGNTLDGYSADDCIPMSENSCKERLAWRGGDDLSFLRGKGFRFRFIQDNAEFYSFWLSPDDRGESGGAMAAGYVSEEKR
ncbi:MAG: glycosyl hydrolase family 32 [Clostridia bacterium]|nr:glycosyl hydrolase family 32 [Clostridia bacterium]